MKYFNKGCAYITDINNNMTVLDVINNISIDSKLLEKKELNIEDENLQISLTFNNFNKNLMKKIIKEFEKDEKYLNKIEEYINEDKKIIKLNNKPYYKKGRWD